MARQATATGNPDGRNPKTESAAYRSISGHAELFTPEQRKTQGRDQRISVPRRTLERFEKSSYRPDPVDVLIQQGEARIAELLPIRYGRMLASPFAFYRGGAAIMSWDLSHSSSTSLSAQLCGDAHLANFGFFGSPERTLVFDINDFDETIRGPFEWDVKRLAASVVLAGRANGFSDSTCADLARSCVARYRLKLAALSDMSTLEVWYSHVTAESMLQFVPRARLKSVIAKMEQARSKDSARAVSKLTRLVDGELRIVDNPPLVTVLPREEVESIIHPLFDAYLQTLADDRRVLLDRFRFVDAAERVVGVGSVGTRCRVVVLVGNDNDDPLVLQLKEAVSSVLAQYVPASPYRNEAERVVQGQRLIQAVSDPFLGWVRYSSGREYYFRQLYNMKASANLDTMGPGLLGSYAGVCGEILARAHARSGDPIRISAYLGKGVQFDEAIGRFAMLYADQTEADYETLVAAVKSGKIEAQTGI